jgi:hypothetical protein
VERGRVVRVMTSEGLSGSEQNKGMGMKGGLCFGHLG